MPNPCDVKASLVQFDTVAAPCDVLVSFVEFNSKDVSCDINVSWIEFYIGLYPGDKTGNLCCSLLRSPAGIRNSSKNQQRMPALVARRFASQNSIRADSLGTIRQKNIR